MKYIGYWKEHRINRFKESDDYYGWDLTKSVKDEVFRVEMEKETKDQILRYLNKGIEVEIVRGVAYDVFRNDTNSIICPIFSYTDGEFVWSEEFIHYFEKYDIEVPKPFFEKIMEKKAFIKLYKQNKLGYIPPEIRNSIMIPSLRDPGETKEMWDKIHGR